MSERSTLLPKETAIALLFLLIKSFSTAENPPSGPTRTAYFLVSCWIGNRDSNIFFVFGPEIVLKNNSVDLINQFLKEKSFNEKKIITESDFSKIENIILENASGSLFGSKIIIEINHLKGKIPKEIVNIFEMQDIKRFNDIALIIKSSIEKINNLLSFIWASILKK